MRYNDDDLHQYFTELRDGYAELSEKIRKLEQRIEWDLQDHERRIGKLEERVDKLDHLCHLSPLW